MAEGMTLRQFIEELESLAKDEGDQIEVVAVTQDNHEIYTPVITVGPCPPDNIRRICVA